MSITNVSKPTTSIVDSAKVSFGETWGAIITTWAAETRTWLDCISLMTNTSRVTADIINSAKP